MHTRFWGAVALIVLAASPGLAAEDLSPDDHVSRGAEYLNAGDLDAAIGEFTRAIEAGEGWHSAPAYNYRGLAYANKGGYARARSDWEKALQLDPDHADAREGLEGLKREGY